MKIVIATPECEQFVRRSGLAEMTRELSVSLHRRGHDITLVHPYYRDIDQEGFPIVDTGERLSVSMAERCLQASVYSLRRSEGINVVFLAHAELFNRPGIYGDEHDLYIDNAERFIFFSRGVLEYCRQAELEPDVIHCFDWPTGLIPLYLKEIYGEGVLSRTVSLFTIYNIRRQGIFERHHMHLTGFDGKAFPPETIQYFGKINFAQAGIGAADVLSTVSSRFAEEICSDEFGFGLENALLSRKDDLYGIPNGVSFRKWNPGRDRFLKANYCFDEMVGKRSCKVDLQNEFELPRDVEVPILAILPPPK